MSYTPTEWKSGDVITSENLNKLEQGVAAAGGGGGGVLKVNMTWAEDGTTCTLDKTYAEIYSAFQNGFVIAIDGDETLKALYMVGEIGYVNDTYGLNILPMNNLQDPMAFVADSESAYPVWTDPYA